MCHCRNVIFILLLLCVAIVKGENVNGKINDVLTEIVKTHSGPIRGIIRQNVLTGDNYAGFLGIPYAEPPLTKMRFLVNKFTDLFSIFLFRLLII